MFRLEGNERCELQRKSRSGRKLLMDVGGKKEGTVVKMLVSRGKD